MTAPEQNQQQGLDAARLPRIIFVLGKGGVGRSTIATALGLGLANRGERVLVLEWAVADPIAPWFGLPPAGPQPVEVSPNLWAANFSLDDALRSYFVDHLHLGVVYRRVIKADAVWRLIDVAPGISEIFFLGELWWLLNLAEKEAGLRFDRIVVDAPATGHGASMLDVPQTLAAMGASGLMALEVQRVTGLVQDPSLTGAVVVALPEPLVIAETIELVPRVGERLGRAPLALLVNRGAGELAGHPRSFRWRGLLPSTQQVLGQLEAQLSERARNEVALAQALAAQTQLGTISLPERLGLAPAGVARSLALELTGGPR